MKIILKIEKINNQELIQQFKEHKKRFTIVSGEINILPSDSTWHNKFI